MDPQGYIAHYPINPCPIVTQNNWKTNIFRYQLLMITKALHWYHQNIYRIELKALAGVM